MSPSLRRAAVLVAALVVAGCATRRPPPVATPLPPVPAVPSDSLAATALAFRGVPYRLGGTDPGGFDCSGLVQYVAAQHGIRLPRQVRQQFGAGRAVRAEQLRPGDLVFFKTSGRQVSHVGIAVDRTRFVHAPAHRGVVRVDRLDAPYWRGRYAGARRVH